MRSNVFISILLIFGVILSSSWCYSDATILPHSRIKRDTIYIITDRPKKYKHHRIILIREKPAKKTEIYLRHWEGISMRSYQLFSLRKINRDKSSAEGSINQFKFLKKNRVVVHREWSCSRRWCYTQKRKYKVSYIYINCVFNLCTFPGYNLIRYRATLKGRFSEPSVFQFVSI